MYPFIDEYILYFTRVFNLQNIVLFQKTFHDNCEQSSVPTQELIMQSGF